jgi:hypothetical protein
MLFTTLVPEYLVGKALNDRLAAKLGVPGMKDCGWEEIHAHLANIGYFVLHIDESLDSARGTNLSLPTSPEMMTLAKSSPKKRTDESLDIELQMSSDIPSNSKTRLLVKQDTGGGDEALSWNHQGSQQQPSKVISVAKLSRGRLRNNSSALDNLTRLRGSSWALTAHQWDCARMDGYVNIPKLDAHDLEKLDRGGKLVKFLALVQVSYLMIQLIGRQIAELSAAQLEIAALAFSASKPCHLHSSMGKTTRCRKYSYHPSKQNPNC